VTTKRLIEMLLQLDPKQAMEIETQIHCLGKVIHSSPETVIATPANKLLIAGWQARSETA
jgi:hypothetical protein